MAGHSHWAGIKHKKGRQDKVRSKLFSKLSREITVAAKLGDKDPDMNPRLRSAIQAAKQSNMPKENISRAISKSESNTGENYENLRYEGYGAFSTALIIETLTDNKNRTASTIRTILQKNGGRLGENGSTSHLFYNCGVIQIDKKNFSNDAALELAINSGANECRSINNYHEIICEKRDFYKVKSSIEKKINNFMYTGIEWRAHSFLKLSKEQKEKVVIMLEGLDEIDDIQNIFTNCEF
tara:strand:+ start:125 stop:841 length:717 start_codon:yes stop_codon:yes gene_type:complete